MSDLCVKIVDDIYKFMNENIDIIADWFQADNKQLNNSKLFNYKRQKFSSIIGNENDIYDFINKFINNILYNKSFKLEHLTYLEANFVSLFNLVIERNKLSKEV